MSKGPERYNPISVRQLALQEIAYDLAPRPITSRRERPLEAPLQPEGILPEAIIDRLRVAEQPNGIDEEERVETSNVFPKAKSRGFWKRMAKVINSPEKAGKDIGTAIIASAEEFFPDFPKKDKTPWTKIKEGGKRLVSMPFRKVRHAVKEGVRKLITNETKISKGMDIWSNIQEILKGEKIRRQSFLYVSSFALGAFGPLLSLTKINIPNIKQAWHEKRFLKCAIEIGLSAIDISPTVLAVKAGLAVGIAAGFPIGIAAGIGTFIAVSSFGIAVQWISNTFLFEAILNKYVPSNKDYTVAARDVLVNGEEGKKREILEVMDRRLTEEASLYEAFRNADGSVNTPQYVQTLVATLNERIAELDRLIHAPQADGEKTDVSELARVEDEALLGDKPRNIFHRFARWVFLPTSVKYHRELLEGHKRELVWARNLREVLVIYENEHTTKTAIGTTVSSQASAIDIA